jgi:transcriptional regulator with XRE-family HTH domain
MERNFGIIFKNARNTAGLTQERWAETLGVSVDAVQNYEYGRNFPTEETVLLMADISGYKILPYQYMSMKSRIGGEILPELDERVSLPKAVLRLMVVLKDLQDLWTPKLMRMAADGKITEDEAAQFKGCMNQLTELTKCVYDLKYAEEEP